MSILLKISASSTNLSVVIIIICYWWHCWYHDRNIKKKWVTILRIKFQQWTAAQLVAAHKPVGKAALLYFCRLYFAFSSGTKNYYFSGLAARKQEKKLLRTVYLHYTDLELPSDASVQWALCDRIRSDRLLGNCSNHRIEILWRLFSRAWLICASSEHGGKTTTYSTDYFCPLFLFYFHL